MNSDFIFIFVIVVILAALAIVVFFLEPYRERLTAHISQELEDGSINFKQYCRKIFRNVGLASLCAGGIIILLEFFVLSFVWFSGRKVDIGDILGILGAGIFAVFYYFIKTYIGHVIWGRTFEKRKK